MKFKDIKAYIHEIVKQKYDLLQADQNKMGTWLSKIEKRTTSNWNWHSCMQKSNNCEHSILDFKSDISMCIKKVKGCVKEIKRMATIISKSEYSIL